MKQVDPKSREGIVCLFLICLSSLIAIVSSFHFVILYHSPPCPPKKRKQRKEFPSICQGSFFFFSLFLTFKASHFFLPERFLPPIISVVRVVGGALSLRWMPSVSQTWPAWVPCMGWSCCLRLVTNSSCISCFKVRNSIYCLGNS